MGKFLVVDDDKANVRLLEALLASLGHEVVKAYSGEECLELLRSTPVDQILLDAMMPGMDGFEVIQRIVENPDWRLIPIVMVTALHDIEYRARALDLGAADFITKPIHKLELRARVESLLKAKQYNDLLVQHRDTLEQQVAERTRELQRAYEQVKATSLEIVFRLVRAAEYKDEDTGSHVHRMSLYSQTIARHAGLPEADCEAILNAAPMHDIGKIGVPDGVLLKPGPLDEAEWVLMRQHTVIGACILEGSTVPAVDLGRIIAISHHEKWDGTGYPLGLKGDDIPVPGQIVAIADVFDALTSKRPYKRALSEEEAFEILRADEGKHFNPRFLKAFFDGIDEIRAIKARYPV